MTVAAISFDRFLFIVKPHLHKRFMRPWVALILTIGIWILSTPLSIVHFYGFNRQYSLDFCTLTSSSINSSIYSLLLFCSLIGIIFVTSVWTYCFSRCFINNQSVTADESVYASRKKRLFGIFGSMLIFYIICFIPGVLEIILQRFIEFTVAGEKVSTVCFIFITIANAIVQAYFRPDIKNVLLSRCPLLSTCVCCSCSHAVC